MLSMQAKTRARLDRANETPLSLRKISNLYFTWRNLVVRLYLKYGVSSYKRTT
ncbi:hypothetical protein HMPREF1586_01127 [Gardnerella vaginalis JCP8522]|nr:hypothetical protein HMPREF1586_01127 [Gardnerella vaginalis JCP8522]